MKDAGKEYLDYLQDILDAAKYAEDFTKGITLAEFKKDRKTVFAATRAIEIIGEATKNLPKILTNQYPGIPWKDIAGMRDKLAHEYFGVDLDVLWKTIQKDVPELRKQIKEVMLDQEKKSEQHD